MRCDIANLKSLSDDAICSIPYQIKERTKWEKGDISSLLNSNAPSFIKDILKHKKREGSSRSKSSWYFGEAYVASILGDYIKHGWFSSFKWLYDPDWITGKNPEQEKDPVIAKLKHEFYEVALMKYIGLKKLNDLQKLWGSEHPKAPDLWLIDKKRRHYLIEVKKESDKPDKEHKQLLGLALLEKYFNMQTFIVYLHPENQKTLSSKKQSKWLSDYNSAKTKVYIKR